MQIKPVAVAEPDDHEVITREPDLRGDQDVLCLQDVELLGGAGLVLRADQAQRLAREFDRALRRALARR